MTTVNRVPNKRKRGMTTVNRVPNKRKRGMTTVDLGSERKASDLSFKERRRVECNRGVEAEINHKSSKLDGASGF